MPVSPPPLPSFRFNRQIIGKGITMRGFIVSQFEEKYVERFYKEIPAKFGSKDLVFKEHVVKGLENVPQVSSPSFLVSPTLVLPEADGAARAIRPSSTCFTATTTARSSSPSPTSDSLAESDEISTVSFYRTQRWKRESRTCKGDEGSLDLVLPDSDLTSLATLRKHPPFLG